MLSLSNLSIAIQILECCSTDFTGFALACVYHLDNMQIDQSIFFDWLQPCFVCAHVCVPGMCWKGWGLPPSEAAGDRCGGRRALGEEEEEEEPGPRILRLASSSHNNQRNEHTINYSCVCCSVHWGCPLTDGMNTWILGYICQLCFAHHVKAGSNHA